MLKEKNKFIGQQNFLLPLLPLLLNFCFYEAAAISDAASALSG